MFLTSAIDKTVMYIHTYITLLGYSNTLSFVSPGSFQLFKIKDILGAIFKTRTTSRLPPSPFKLPIIGHLHLLAPIPHQALHKLSSRHGSLIHVFLGSYPCVVASSPEMAKEFLKTHETSWSDRPQTEATDYSSQDFSFAPYGSYWKFVEKLCMSELLGGRTLDLLRPVRRHEIESFVNVISEKAKAGEAVDVGEELIRLTNNVISRMIMRERCSENEDEAGEVRKMIKEVAEITGKFNLSDYIWFCKNLDLQGIKKRLVDLRKRFDTMMERIIEEHREVRGKLKKNGNGGGDATKDLLDISEDESMETRLSRENIKAFIPDIFAAGTDICHYNRMGTGRANQPSKHYEQSCSRNRFSRPSSSVTAQWLSITRG